MDSVKADLEYIMLKNTCIWVWMQGFNIVLVFTEENWSKWFADQLEAGTLAIAPSIPFKHSWILEFNNRTVIWSVFLTKTYWYLYLRKIVPLIFTCIHVLVWLPQLSSVSLWERSSLIELTWGDAWGTWSRRCSTRDKTTGTSTLVQYRRGKNEQLASVLITRDKARIPMGVGTRGFVCEGYGNFFWRNKRSN